MKLIALTSKNKSCGYTLIELVVILAIFLFVVAAAIGIFLSIIVHQKRVLAEQQLLYQISYAEEYVSKALRMATVDIDGSCLGGQGFIYLLTDYDTNTQSYRGIKFLNQSDADEYGTPACQKIYFEKENPDCADESLLECQLVLKEIKNDSVPVNLTSTDLKINLGQFIVNAEIIPDCSGSDPCVAASRCITQFCTQPRVTTIFDVQLPGEKQAIRRFQTTVSQRNLNAP